VVTNNNELLGQALGTCTLRRLIGRGGMGAVYLAQQTRPRRTVAVKVLMPSTFLDQKPRADFLMRFRREADAVAALDHINIMPIYEYGEQGDLAYLVMPYVTGGTLRQLLEKRGKLSLAEAVPIIEQAAAGLDTAHAQGIIHRDLKPGNILFHADGRVLLADFGLAKMVNDAQEFDSNGQTALTSAGTIIGTPEYLSPEQGTGKLVDPRTDIYSLGIVLFQMLGGQVPFSGASPVAVAIKHALEEPPSLTQLNPAIPPSVEAVVRKAIAKNPDDRYNSAGELAHALREAANLAAERDSKKSTYAAYETVIEQPGSMKLPDASPASSEASNAPAAEGTKDPAFNAALTEEVPPVPATKIAEPSPSVSPLANAETVVETPQDVKEMSPVQNKQARRDEPAMQPVRLAQQQVLPTEQAANAFREEASSRRKGGLPVPMMLIGGLLVLVLIVGGSVAYFTLGKSSVQHTTGTTHAGTPVAKSTALAQITPTPVTIKPGISQAGQQLYATTIPGPGTGCDTQGGKWTSTAGASISCSANGMTLDNRSGSQPVAVFLQAMKNGQPFPGSYVIQAQVTINAGSSGNFGIVFLSQSAQNERFAWMLNPGNNTGQANTYSDDMSPLSQVTGPITISQNRMGTTATVDVAVQGNSSNLYVNGSGYPNASVGGSTGILGLAADAGTSVTFKNVAVYTLY
jgi:serine/threonine protein kinase